VPTLAFNVVGNPLRNYHDSSYAVFVQDDWRIKPKLTLNLGLRWEYTGPIPEANNLLANFIPGSPTGMVQVGRGISSAYDREKTNFAPRVGAAWDISGNGTTVIRAGGGLFYDMLPNSVFTDMAPNLQNAHTPGIGKTPTGALLVLPNGSTMQGTGTIATAAFTYSGAALNWTVAGPVFPSSATIACGNGVVTIPGPNNTVLTPTPCNIFSIARDFRTPYVGIWTVTLEHAFSPSLSLEVAYVGNHGDALSGVVDANQLDPQSGAEIACKDCEAIADRPFGTEYPYLAVINQLRNPYRSNYNGLQATLSGRHYHNLSFVAGYTYSHALDDMTFSVLNYTPQDSRNIAAQYGNSDFDTRHRFTLTTTWDIPGKKGLGQILGARPRFSI
jgi:outer membrane receptor protein involved in Fe transport